MKTLLLLAVSAALCASASAFSQPKSAVTRENEERDRHNECVIEGLNPGSRDFDNCIAQKRVAAAVNETAIAPGASPPNQMKDELGACDARAQRLEFNNVESYEACWSAAIERAYVQTGAVPAELVVIRAATHRVESLAALVDMGKMTAEQFQADKNRILGEMANDLVALTNEKIQRRRGY